ncbi:retrovirus-related pol polyprotein from transposon TNT 1-94 [Tanacetum coccineum]|uniref:Retrovirus-related pol polyprotein from transposon TNT 1-94 n=1 Tax=Tanacetum coccineum TaxID=301880 RepID=A0ABQ5IUL0_9ASTR
MSANTKFTKQSILGKPPSSSKSKLYSVTPFPNSKVIPKVGETNALLKLVTSNSAPSTRESKVVKNDNVIAPGMFRINPSKTSRVDNVMPNKPVKASVRTKPITTSQPHVISQENVNFNSNVVCAMCKQCLIIANHDVCVLNYVNVMNSRDDKHSANVLKTAIQKKYKTQVKKPKKLGSTERLASPKPSKPRTCLRWSPTGRIFDCPKGDNACTSNPHEPTSKRFPIPLLFLAGTVRFGNDHVAAIIEVAFRINICVVKNLNGVDLLKGDRTTNLYTINLHEMAYASLICLIARATSTKKSKKASHPPKPVPNSKQRLQLLHMDLCGPMRVEIINGKRYILVIMDDYSCYTWVHFLRSKDEAPEVIKTFLKKIQVLLQALVIIVRTDNGAEFKNQVLKEYFDSVGISHQSSSVRTP